MKMYAYGSFNPLTEADRIRIQSDRYQNQKTKDILLKAKYPNLYSWDGKILIGTDQDWAIAYPMLVDDEVNELRDLDYMFMEPLMLVRDIRGVMATYDKWFRGEI